MHLDIAGLFTLAFAGLGIIGLLAAAATIARSSSIKEHLELLRGEVADLTAAHARAEGENSQLRKRVEQMQAEAVILRDLVTSRADVAQIATEMRGLVQTMHRDYLAIMALFRGNQIETFPPRGPADEPQPPQR